MLLRLCLGASLRVVIALHFIGSASSSSAQHSCLETKRNAHAAQAKSNARELAPIDLIHQRISLDLTLGNVIKGECAIRAVPRTDGLTSIDLDLADLVVDSVVMADENLIFTQNGEVLSIDLPAPMNMIDTFGFTVHYGGDPSVDASGFGGFYTSTALTYNLGVAFQSVPHSYGRSWFPCLDNFTERSTYEFWIKTAGGRKAWCNGLLVERIPLGGDTLMNHWSCANDMPAYLVSVAAANYVVARDSFPSTAGQTIPVELIASPGDTADMRASFAHLADAFHHFEGRFGPYRWEKVGYVLTTNGAMEHSTSIHYPASAADGSLAYEATMAHELAHHWFGNLITCERAEEMYINEGFAEYLSYLFLEQVYGTDRYLAEVRSNHRSMVHRAHLVDEGWWALSEMPQAWTYGTTTYNKGADVAHSLRSYMGDDAFFAGMTSFLTSHAYQPVNTTMLRDHLSASSGMDLSDFFADWVQQPGWAAFEIDTQIVTPGEDGWIVQLTLQQKQRGPATPYHNVPLSFAVVGAGAEQVYRDTVLVGGSTAQVAFTVPFEPAWVWMNDDDRLSLAFTGTTDTVSTTAALNLVQANMELRPAPGNSTVIRVEQYWVAPDQGTFAEPFAHVLSPDRYWRVTGNWSDASRFAARLPFDGRPGLSLLDPGLLHDTLGVSFHEDSLLLLYRAKPNEPWAEWPSDVVNLGSDVDGYGRLETDSLLPGEYAMAWRTSAVGIALAHSTSAWTVAPNPAKDMIRVHTSGAVRHGTVILYDGQGRVVRSTPLHGQAVVLDTSALPPGGYTLRFVDPNAAEEFVGPVIIGR